MSMLCGVLACSKDPKVNIYDQLEFDQCICPVNVRYKVEYVTITVSCDKTFPDSEKYELEVYSAPLPPEDGTNEEALIGRYFFLPDEFPYSITGPDETPCYLRLRALNETAGRKPSRWTSGYVVTDVDPEKTCARPSDAKAVANYTSVTFSWTPAANVKEYELEIYKEPLPTSGEPFASNLYCPKIVKAATEIPFIMEFPIRQFFYRVRATNEEDGLRASSWVKGSFTTSEYAWPTDNDAFDYGYSHTNPRTATISEEAFAHAFDGSTELVWAPGASVPAPVTVDNVTTYPEYTVDGVTYGSDVKFESDADRVTFANCNKWNKTDYSENFPLNRYVCFKVNKPGSVSFIVRLLGSTAPKLFVGIKTKKTGAVQFENIYKADIVITPTINEKNEENRVTIDIPRDKLMGIDEAATVYIYGGVVKMSIYPITWTPAANQ